MADYVNNVRKAGTETKVPIYSNGYLVKEAEDGEIIIIDSTAIKVPTLIKVSAGISVTIDPASSMPIEVVVDAAAETETEDAAVVSISGNWPKVGSISEDDNDKRRMFSFLNGTIAVGVFEPETSTE